MSFTSWPFAALTIVTLALYYLPPLRRFQIQTLLVASVYFYAYEEWRFLPLLLGTLFFTFYCVGNGRQLQAIGIIANLMVLAVFKYKFLFVGVQDELPSNVVGMLLALPLPIGISFFVFHNISMLVDFVQRKLPRPKFPFDPRSAFGKCARRAVLSMYRIRRRRAYRCQLKLLPTWRACRSSPVIPADIASLLNAVFWLTAFSDPRETTHRWPSLGYCQAYGSPMYRLA